MTTVKQVRSVANTCAVVESIAAHQPIGVSELARRTGLDKSGVHRIAVTLHQAGWLRPAAGGTTRWELAPTFARLARGGGTASLAALVRPAMQALRDETEETVLLAVLDGGRLVVDALAESRHPVRLISEVGTELPIPGSAAARAIAAHLPRDELARLRSAQPGIDDERRLAPVRRRGWSTNDGEVADDVRAVAAPVLDDSGYPLGALVVCGPISRVGRADMQRFGRLTARAALGGRA